MPSISATGARPRSNWRDAPRLLLGLLITAFVVCGLAGTQTASAGTRTEAPTTRYPGSRAVVVVDTGASVKIRLISFSAESISGLEALQIAGASPETIGFSQQGVAVCRLFEVGNPATPSLCLGTGADPRYWAYHRSEPGANTYRYSPVGAGATRVNNGSVEAWHYGTGSPAAYVAFCQVAECAPDSSPQTQQGSGSAPEPAAGSDLNSGSGSGSSSGTAGGASDSRAPDDGSASSAGSTNDASGSADGAAPLDSIVTSKDDSVTSGMPGDATSTAAADVGREVGNKSDGANLAARDNANFPNDSDRRIPGRTRGPMSLLVFGVGIVGLLAAGIYYRRTRA